MKVNVKEFLKEAGITEPFYPGKRLVHSCRQPGEFKSHSVVLDWRQPDKIRIEVKAGLSGKTLTAKELKYYPVSFQTPTYVDIEILNDNAKSKKDEDEEEGGTTSGSASGGGGKQPKKSLSDLKSMAAGAFGSVMEGKIPEFGKIVEMVILGTKIVAQSYGNVMGALAKQISHAKVATTDLLARGGDFVTKYTPPAFMAPVGNEDKVYKYDRVKNENIGYNRPSIG